MEESASPHLIIRRCSTCPPDRTIHNSRASNNTIDDLRLHIFTQTHTSVPQDCASQPSTRFPCGTCPLPQSPLIYIDDELSSGHHLWNATGEEDLIHSPSQPLNRLQATRPYSALSHAFAHPSDLMSSPISIFSTSDTHFAKLHSSFPPASSRPTSPCKSSALDPSNSASCFAPPPLDSTISDTLGSDPALLIQRQTPARLDRKPVPEFKTPPAAGKKRRLSAVADREGVGLSQSAPLHKRRRVPSFQRHTLDAFDFLPAFSEIERPTSPLFFSNSIQRPRLPPRFTSAEAGARMLSKAHADEGTIRTVTLARGSYAGSSPPIPPVLSARLSGLPKSLSPESNEQSRILAQIGVVELLEQDSRPTFIVDLGESANYTSACLRIVFANSALRANAHLLDAIQGRSSDSSPRSDASNESVLKNFSSFKAWLLSASANGESLEVCLPALIHGGLSWTCSTLRKRLRVVSASGTVSRSNVDSVSSAASDHPMLLASPHNSALRTSSASSRRHQVQESSDYFGDAGLHSPRIRSTSRISSNTNAMEAPTKEESPPGMTQKDASAETVEDSPDIRAVYSSETLIGVDDGVVNTAQQKDVGFFDWTRLPVSNTLPQHIQFARSVDWANTALGPIEYWCSDLRQMCNLIMASPHPAAMYWGDDLVAIYNEAYVLLAGQKHPKLMGQSYRDAWAEIWDDVKDVFASARVTGQATMKDDDCLFIKRSHFLEETYFSWSIIPMVGSDGAVTGLYNPAFEKTRRKVAERRMLTLREIGERTATARDVKSFWQEVADAFDLNEYDTPFVLLYSLTDEMDSDASSVHSSSVYGGRSCILEGSLGVPEDHRAAPPVLDLRNGMDGFAPFFRECMRTEKPALLHVVNDLDPSGTGPITPPSQSTDTGPRLHASLLEGIETRGFRDSCSSVVVCPVHPTTGESTLGFLVLGVNPRRPYDDDYHLFIQLLSRQLATSLASVVLFEEEIRRGQRAAKLAALDRIELSEQLAVRTQEAKDIETRFTRMAELSPTGLFIADSQGHITYCNDTWFEITRVPKDAISIDRWMSALQEDDRTRMQEMWNRCTTQHVPVSGEFRFKARWEDREGNRSDTWVLFAAYPEKNDYHDPGAPETLKSIFGSITDISQQKWVEGLQRMKMEEAIELKRQQENFIDITSHEMRNPLSAILQCADEIATTLEEARASGGGIDMDTVINSIDAAQTIALCAQHQKRIVDDVLTLSKLDSMMLLVTPVDVQPVAIVQRSLKMFENEINSADIKLQFIVDQSLEKLDVNWVKFDPQRVLQVLINLTTNAIKFTSSESKRTIAVSISASLDKPSEAKEKIVDFFPSRRTGADLTANKDWGTGETVYILFAVQDTGRGLTVEEKKLLFMRFSQASPRTHITYGGSGLGLFISRELTELQGGEIGVASEAGKGSTFAFYIKAKRSVKPTDENQQFPALIKSVSDPKHAFRSEKAVLTKDFAPESDGRAPALPRAQRNIHVLIVEDNLVNQRVLLKQLKHLGFTCFVANHGGEALDRLRESSFWHENLIETMSPKQTIDIHVVLMDQEMPVMDGLKATTKIREWEASGELVRHVPIIAVTANARSEQIDTLMKIGMDSVQSKPFRISDLVPKIEAMASRFPQPKPKGSTPMATSSTDALTSGKGKKQA